jgi:hypothetical protein
MPVKSSTRSGGLSEETFAGLTLDEQVRFLADRLPGTPAEDLLSLCAGIRDHDPLVWLCQKVLESDWFKSSVHQAWFAGFLLQQPDTAILRILKNTVNAEKMSEPAFSGALCTVLLDCLTRVPLSQLSAMCLIDRITKQNFPLERRAYLDKLLCELSQAITDADYEHLALDRLAQVPARDLGTLESLARAQGVDAERELRDRWTLLLQTTVQILGSAPKGVSQANAEELLSKRVYSDPGHFLVELLQNAEDAGAKSWSIHFDRDQITVWHDGIPFDVRDLVGVTSIGQTTKGKDQIGFFGVGFKAIYEVTNRPQVYSETLWFEIADVSIPKLLSQRPAGIKPTGTTLILPLRPKLSHDRSPAILFKKAAAIDPCVLVTLRSMEHISLELTTAAGGPRQHCLSEHLTPASDGFLSRLVQQPDGWHRTYLVQDETFVYSGTAREAGRPQKTQAMVGIMLGDDGAPVPLADDAATVYSFLPTLQKTGLRFFIQAHFDLLVDRERITPGSSWNRWILEQAPGQLAQIARKLLMNDDAPPENVPTRLAGWLAVLPLPDELDTAFAVIAGDLPRALGDLAFLIDARGRRFSPRQAVLASPDIASLFASSGLVGPNCPFTTAADQLWFPDLPPHERRHRLLRSLGAHELTLTELVGYLEALFRGHVPGTPVAGEQFPEFLTHRDLPAFARFYEYLQTALEQAPKPERQTLTDRLARLPLYPGDDGGLHPAATETGTESATETETAKIAAAGTAIKAATATKAATGTETATETVTAPETAPATSTGAKAGAEPRARAEPRAGAEPQAEAAEGIKQADISQAGIRQMGIRQANSKQSESSQAGIRQMGIRQADSKQSESSQAGIRQAGPALRALFHGFVPLLDEYFRPSGAGFGPGPVPRYQVFFENVGITLLTPEHLCTQLTEACRASPESLPGLEAVAFIGTQDRLDRILQTFIEAPVALREQSRRFPLFAGIDGRLYRPAAAPDDTVGVLAYFDDPVTQRLLPLYSGSRPLSAFPQGSKSPAVKLLSLLETPTLSLDLFVRDIESRAAEWRQAPGRIRQVHEVLAQICDDVHPRTLKDLAAHAIWPDTEGALRPLTGPNAALLPQDPDIATFFPGLPLLHPEYQAFKHVHQVPGRRLDARFLINALNDGTPADCLTNGPVEPPAQLPAIPETIRRVQAYLSAHPDDLQKVPHGEITRAPLFLDDKGKPRAFNDLLLPETPAIRLLYGDLPERFFLEPGGPDYIFITQVLNWEKRLQRGDFDTLVTDLTEAGEELFDPVTHEAYVCSGSGLERLVRFFSQIEYVVAEIKPKTLEQILTLPLFPDEQGQTGRIGTARAKTAGKGVLPVQEEFRPIFAAAGLRLLHPLVQKALPNFFKLAKAPFADLEKLIALLGALPQVHAGEKPEPTQTIPVLHTVAGILFKHRGTLLERYRPGVARAPDEGAKVLNQLAIWPTVAGGVVSADHLLATNALLETTISTSTEYPLIAEVTLHPDFLPDFQNLRELFGSLRPAPFLASLVKKLGKPLVPLSRQPGFFLATVGRLARLLEFFLSEENLKNYRLSIPLADAMGRLQFAALPCGPAAYHELLQGLSFWGGMLHPDFPLDKMKPLVENGLAETMSDHQVLGLLTSPDERRSIPVVRDPERRAAFFAWLIREEAALFAQPEFRQLLTQAPVFPNAGGIFVEARALLLNSPFQHLLSEWRPAAEVSTSLQELLMRQLNIGTPSREVLLKTHIGVAFLEIFSYEDPPPENALLRQLHRERAFKLTQCLGELFAGLSAGECALLLAKTGLSDYLRFEDGDGVFRTPADLHLVTPEIAAAMTTVWGSPPLIPSPTRFPPEFSPTLLQLGVLSHPHPQRLQAVLESHPTETPRLMALALLIADLAARRGRDLLEPLNLNRHAWLPAEDETPHPPGDLFRAHPDVEALIGHSPGAFLHPDIAGFFPEELFRLLEFRTIRQIRPEEVIAHLRLCATQNRPVSFLSYDWLEEGLRRKSISEAFLKTALAGSPWIYTDDGAHFPPEKTLGIRAFSLFGEYRGYWETGVRRFPHLCRVFELAVDVSGEMVGEFLREIGKAVRQTTDFKVLKRDPALPRLLLAAYAFLGKRGDTLPPDIPVILAVEHAPSTAPGASGEVITTERLLPANAATLFFNDAPDLCGQFARQAPGWGADPEKATDGVFVSGQAPGWGADPVHPPGLVPRRGEKATDGVFVSGQARLHTVVAPANEQRDDIERFYLHLGIRRLSRSLRISPGHDSGRDETAERSLQIQNIRAQLRGLAEVLPRVRLARGTSLPGTWHFTERLARLATSGAIKAIAGLRVRCQLPGVGEMALAEPAFYDPESETLLLDTQMVELPETAVSRLAATLLPCIYQGPGEESLLDLTEILLNRQSVRAMQAYLDARRFPTAQRALCPRDRLRERLGELLDFGLDKHLTRHFPHLSQAAWNHWRTPEFAEKLAKQLDPTDATQAAYEAWVESLLPFLLSALAAPGAAGIAGIPGSPSISGISGISGLSGTTGISGIADIAGIPGSPNSRVTSNTAAPVNPAAPASPATTASLQNTLKKLLTPASLNEVVDSFSRELAEEARERERGTQQTTSAHNTSSGAATGTSAADSASAASAASAAESAAASTATANPLSAIVNRLSTWFGWKTPAANETPPTPEANPDEPEWARPTGNSLSTDPYVRSQLWQTREIRERLKSTPATSWLSFNPGRLESPHAYSIHTLGARFDPISQAWLPGDYQHQRLDPITPKALGQVFFQGTLAPGEVRLPVPLYARLDGPIEVLEGAPENLDIAGTDSMGGLTVAITGNQPISVRYSVLLSAPPVPLQRKVDPQRRQALLAPTLPLQALPNALGEWIGKNRGLPLSPFELTQRVKTFIQAHYVYDEFFRELPEVMEAARRLEKGVGNHHLQQLHAGGNAKILGRGVCYELNILVVEVLRHLGIPALAATCHLHDKGLVERPDHLVALALLESNLGPFVLPIDAASTNAAAAAGPRTGAGSVAGTVTGSAGNTTPTRAVPGKPATEVPQKVTETGHQDELALLEQALDLVSRAKRVPNPHVSGTSRTAGTSGKKPHDAIKRMKAELTGLLGNANLTTALLAVLRHECREVPTLTPPLRQLQKLGLIDVEKQERFSIALKTP